jgi:hypothetical protein
MNGAKAGPGMAFFLFVNFYQKSAQGIKSRTLWALSLTMPFQSILNGEPGWVNNLNNNNGRVNIRQSQKHLFVHSRLGRRGCCTHPFTEPLGDSGTIRVISSLPWAPRLDEIAQRKVRGMDNRGDHRSHCLKPIEELLEKEED